MNQTYREVEEFHFIHMVVAVVVELCIHSVR